MTAKQRTREATWEWTRPWTRGRTQKSATKENHAMQMAMGARATYADEESAELALLLHVMMATNVRLTPAFQQAN